MERISILNDRLSTDRMTLTRLPDDTGVLLDLESLHVHALNATALFLFEAIAAGAQSAEDLTRMLVDEFEVDQETARADVASFLSEVTARLGSATRR